MHVPRHNLMHTGRMKPPAFIRQVFFARFRPSCSRVGGARCANPKGLAPASVFTTTKTNPVTRF